MFEVYDCWPTLIATPASLNGARHIIEREVSTKGGFIYQSQPAPHDNVHQVLTTCGVFIIKENINAR